MTQNISISKIKPNTGQIDGLPANPRFIRDEKFEALKLSLQEDPEMLELRELIVFPLEEEYIIIGGNMRYRCALDLKFEELPCKILSPETSVKKLRAITIKDNVSFGQWNMDILANEWDITELELWGMDLVAEYYAHSPKDVQCLMEKSALVIIDFDKAIENGYTQMKQDVYELMSEDLDDEE